MLVMKVEKESIYLHPPGSGTSNSTVVTLAIISVIIIAAAVLVRVISIFSDFWLDEIYTCISLRPLKSPLDIFTMFMNDNNHYLNSLFIYFIGDTPDWYIYRIPSLAAGVLTIPMVWLSVRWAGTLEACIASILTAAAYLLINYSSEARGYGLVIFFSAATWYCLQRCLSGRLLRWRILLWISMSLGILSHLTFIFVLGAALIWFIYDRVKQKLEPLWSVALQWLFCFAVPLILSACLYFFVVRRGEGGYGPEYRITDILAETLSYFGGEGQFVVPLTILWGALAAAMALGGILLLRSQGKSVWVFFLMVIFLAPAAALCAHRPGALFVRYFMINIFFGYIALSFLLAEFLRRAKPLKVAAGIFLLVFIAGNSFQAVRLLEYGRGGYRDALLFIEDNTPGATVAIASDFVFRNEILVDYYRQFMPPGKEVYYVESYPADQPPPWYIIHAIGTASNFKKEITDPEGNTFSLRRIFPCAGPSGFTWAIYSRPTGRLSGMGNG